MHCVNMVHQQKIILFFLFLGQKKTRLLLQQYEHGRDNFYVDTWEYTFTNTQRHTLARREKKDKQERERESRTRSICDFSDEQHTHEIKISWLSIFDKRSKTKEDTHSEYFDGQRIVDWTRLDLDETRHMLIQLAAQSFSPYGHCRHPNRPQLHCTRCTPLMSTCRWSARQFVHSEQTKCVQSAVDLRWRTRLEKLFAPASATRPMNTYFATG
jgi:hypothetical protein